jgi:predicted nucleic-acid-binding Zn-ribbon protein
MDKCPKCGGVLTEGEIRFASDSEMPSPMNYMAGIPRGGAPSVYPTSTSCPYWEEKTGRRTGFIIKSEEKKALKINAYRCTLCGYIEMYTSDKHEEC